jgi:hypothetical protein
MTAADIATLDDPAVFGFAPTRRSAAAPARFRPLYGVRQGGRRPDLHDRSASTHMALSRKDCKMAARIAVPIDTHDRNRERKRAVSAYDAMRAARPLKPPPLPRTVYAPRASEVALLRDIREGAYVP